MAHEQNETIEAVNKQTARRFFSTVGLGALALLAATQLGAFLIGFLVQLLFSDLATRWYYSWFVSFVPLYGLGVPALLYVLRRLPHVEAEDTEPATDAKRPSVGWWVLCLVTMIGASYIGSFMGQYVLVGLSALTGKIFFDSLSGLVDRTPLWATVLFTVVLAPIAEEFLFRKVFIDRIRRYGDTAAILLSATFFALFHGNLHQMFYAFFAGAILGYAYVRTGKMRWNVSLHMAFNALGGLLIPYLLSLGNGLGARIGTPFIYASMALAVLLVLAEIKKSRLRKNPIPMSRDSLFSAMLGAPGVAVAFVCYTLVIVLNMFLLSA